MLRAAIEVIPLERVSCLKNRINSSIAQSVERRTVKSAALGKPPNLLQKSRLNSTTYKAYLT